MSSCRKVCVKKRAVCRKGDSNVICVDWRKGADTLIPNQAALNTRVVGAIVAVMINQLNSRANAQFNNIHIIGHSLGAHTAGYAGAKTKQKIDRITGTGLDPAVSFFRKTKPVVRLNPGDAKFVDVIHTDGEKLFQGGFSINQRIGHADFYPNGGKDQPGCPTDTGIHAFSRLLKGQKLDDFALSFGCDHSRAHSFFIESINSNCLFRALRWVKVFENRILRRS